MEQGALARLGCDLAAGQQVRRRFTHGGIGALDCYGGLIFFTTVEDYYDQAIGFQLRRSGGREIYIHDGRLQVSTVEGGTRNSATKNPKPIVPWNPHLRPKDGRVEHPAYRSGNSD
jgi:hypothetical protein